MLICKKDLENKLYIFAGLNYAIIKDSYSAITLENKGIGYQLGIGKNLHQQLSIEAVYQSIPIHLSATGTTVTEDYDMTSLRLGATYAF
jgi:hypothetical protein